MIAVDTDVLVSLWLPAAGTSVSEKIYNCDPMWVAPYLWRSEFRNVVSIYMHRGVSFESGVESIERAEALMKGHEYLANSADVLKLATESGCPSCRCEFIQVARSNRVPLVTFDNRLLEKFPGVAIHPLTFIKKFS